MAMVHEVFSVLTIDSGLSWHTDDDALKRKFEEFGSVEEAVCIPLVAHVVRFRF